MSFLDKIVAAVTPPESEEDRAQAHRDAQDLAASNPWLDRALRHHEQIGAAFERARHATNEGDAQVAVRQLADVLIAHSVAEEVVLYPVLAIEGHKGHASMAYEEQQLAKVQMAELERLTPLSEDWRDKLEHIRGAVMHHIYEEESTWFPEIAREVDETTRAMLDQRFAEEYNRYMGKVGG
jgi:iron-sulfur cluster repair protein YtfE (RIC family)